MIVYLDLIGCCLCRRSGRLPDQLRAFILVEGEDGFVLETFSNESWTQRGPLNAAEEHNGLFGSAQRIVCEICKSESQAPSRWFERN